MAHTRRSLLLDRRSWDITLDDTGRIALETGAAATAQNVANEARLFVEDAYFVQDQGIPHFMVDLGQRLRDALLRSHLRRAALHVPDVREVQSVDITSFDPLTRTISGDIQIVTVEEADDGAIRTYF